MTPPKGYVCLRTPRPPRLDGKLEGVEWDSAPWTDDFVDIADGPTPRFRTRAKMLWDERALYIGAELEEPHVWGTITQRDAVIFRDNDFEVFLDPDGDHTDYLELEVNTLGTPWDLRLPCPYLAGGSEEPYTIEGLRVGIHVDGTLNDPSDLDRGWSVTLAWPWNDLSSWYGGNLPPEEGDEWRINFSRVQWRHDVEGGRYVKREEPEDNWVWSPQGVVDMHRPWMWGRLVFAAAPRPMSDDAEWADRMALVKAWEGRPVGDAAWAATCGALKIDSRARILRNP